MSPGFHVRACKAITRGAAIALLMGLWTPRLLPQTNDQTATILKRLDQLEKQNAELLIEINALRQRVGEPVAAQVPRPDQAAPVPAAPAETAAERQDVAEHRIEELAQTKLESSQRFPVQLTGTALFNAFTNGRYNGDDQDPVLASATSGPRNSGASFRQTVLGLKFTGPQTFLGGTVSGSLYMDFFGGSSFSLNHLFRLRLATIQLDWKNTTLAVGQDKPIVSRREPNSLAQVGVSPLTAAGNPWLWQPQARIEHRIRLGSQTELKAEGGIFLTAERNNTNLIAEAARPSFETRVSIKRSFSADRSLEVAPVFHISTSHVGGFSVPSRLFGVDWLLKPSAKLEITGLLFHGENFSGLGALGGFNLSRTGTVIPIHGSGGWLQFRYLATRKLSFNTYGGQQDDRNSDLHSGQVGKNQYYAGNAMYLLAPNVVAAFEFGQNRTTYLGVGNRLNNHYDLALAYLF